MTEEEQKKAVETILADPANEAKYPEAFAQARKVGLLKDNKIVDPSKTDPILTEIQNRYGNGYSSKEDFFSEYDKLKNGGAGAEFLKGLPEPILNTIDDFTNHRDWERHFAKTSVVDYSKNYSDDELLTVYYPNKFTQEELSDPENVAVKAARKSAKEAFLIQRQEKADAARLAKTRKENFEKRQKDSLELALSDLKTNLKKMYPKMDDNKLSSIEGRLRSELTSGAFIRKFINEDGTFNTGAASSLFPISFQSEFTGAWKDMGRAEGEKVAHDILNNGGQARSYNRTAIPPKDNSPLKIKEEPTFKLTPVK